MVYKPTNITGGPHPVGLVGFTLAEMAQECQPQLRISSPQHYSCRVFFPGGFLGCQG